MKVLDCRETRELEQRAVEYGANYADLMEMAGAAVTCFLRKHFEICGKQILILCGKGNNGGDGFVIAYRLWEAGAKVTIVLLDGLPQTELARQRLANVRSTSIHTLSLQDDEGEIDAAILQADLIVDAIYGIGFRGSVPEAMRPVFFAVNDAKVPVVAVDIPSGLNGDTGRVEGVHIKADHTITFSTKKPVHFFLPAKQDCGNVLLADVGIPEDVLRKQECGLEVVEHFFLNPLTVPRSPETNKGSYGRLLAVCGQEGMAGAAVLAAKAAVRCGTGLVDLALPKSLYPVAASHLVEPIFTLLQEGREGNRLLSEQLAKSTACLVGCGMGCGESERERVYELIAQSRVPLVLDADGINAVAQNIDILKTARAPLILTPHPGEMARLLGMTAQEVQKNRLEIARSFVQQYPVILVLKGNQTLIAVPSREISEESTSHFTSKVYINPTGNPGMAKGGSGDVLAGMIAAFCAQGIKPWQAAVLGVYLHGLAGDRCAKKYSERAMLPTDLLEELPALFLELEER